MCNIISDSRGLGIVLLTSLKVCLQQNTCPMKTTKKFYYNLRLGPTGLKKEIAFVGG